MEYQPAIYALKKLHAELGGKIKDNRKEAARLALDMKNVEAVMKLLDPRFDVTAISARRRYKENPYFKRGECFRQVLSILRTAQGPLTTREIVVLMLKERGLKNPSPETIRANFPAVASSLKNYKGKTVEKVGEGMPAKWVVIMDNARPD